MIAAENFDIAETYSQNFITAFLSSAAFEDLTNVKTVWTKGRTVDKKIAAEEQGATLKLLREIQKEAKKIAFELEYNGDREATSLMHTIADEIAIQVERGNVASNA